MRIKQEESEVGSNSTLIHRCLQSLQLARNLQGWDHGQESSPLHSMLQQIPCNIFDIFWLNNNQTQTNIQELVDHTSSCTYRRSWVIVAGDMEGSKLERLRLSIPEVQRLSENEGREEDDIIALINKTWELYAWSMVFIFSIGIKLELLLTKSMHGHYLN